MPPRKDLGSILVDEDVLDAKDLERVSRAQHSPPYKERPLWAALLEAELATTEEIFRALSARFGVPVVPDERMAEVEIPETFKGLLNRNQARAGGLLPIDVTADGQRVTVVMVDPSDEATLADFLKRARVPEGRALLARRESLFRAIDRCLGEATAVVAPLAPPPPPRRRQTTPAVPAPTPPPPALVTSPPPPPPPPPSKPMMPVVHDDDITGTVKLDPSLQAELQRLPARMLQSEPLTPVPQNRPAPRPRKATPPPAPTPAPPAAVASPAIVPNTTPPGGVEAWGGGTAGQSPEEALRAEERFSRALVGAVEALATELEARIMGGAGQGAEMARLSRRVARQLGIGRRAADEIGVAAQLFAVDRLLRNLDGAASADLFADLGWAAAGESGLVPTLRALTAASAGFGRVTANQPSPTGARIIGAVADYLELGAATTAIPDLDTVSQLLRASPAGAQVVDALLRVLEIDRGDVTPTSPTVTPAGPGQGAKRGVVAATSVLKPAEDDALTPLPTVISPPPGREIAREPRDDDKTVRKPMPTQRKKEGE